MWNKNERNPWILFNFSSLCRAVARPRSYVSWLSGLRSYIRMKDNGRSMTQLGQQRTIRNWPNSLSACPSALAEGAGENDNGFNQGHADYHAYGP